MCSPAPRAGVPLLRGMARAAGVRLTGSVAPRLGPAQQPGQWHSLAPCSGQLCPGFLLGVVGAGGPGSCPRHLKSEVGSEDMVGCPRSTFGPGMERRGLPRLPSPSASSGPGLCSVLL